MKINLLFESPIAGYASDNIPEMPIKFNEKLSNLLSKCPGPDWIVLIQTNDLQNSTKPYQEQIDQFMEWSKNKTLSKEQIAKLVSISPNKIEQCITLQFWPSTQPFTTWTFLHDIGHAITEHELLSYNDAHDIDNEHTEQTLAHFRNTLEPNTPVLKMKSWNHGRGPFWDDPINELWAEYLWHGGKIRTDNNAPNNLKNFITTIENKMTAKLEYLKGKTIQYKAGFV